MCCAVLLRISSIADLLPTGGRLLLKYQAIPGKLENNNTGGLDWLPAVQYT